MRFLLGTFVLAAVGLFAQATNVPSDAVPAIVGRLELERYKAHIKGLSQFGDRMQGTQRNRDAINWLERELRSLGYTNVERHRFMSGGGPLENIYATKTGTTVPGEMYIVSAHMDGRGGGDASDDDASGCAIVLELARVLGMADVGQNRSVSSSLNNENSGWTAAGPMRSNERRSGHGSGTEMVGRHTARLMLFDHGMPPGRNQSPNADINIEYQANSRMAGQSAQLASALQAANRLHAERYRATIGNNMAGTDSIRFEDLVASVSVRENERVTGIVAGSNPNHHEPRTHDNYGGRLSSGFNSAQTTLGVLRNSPPYSRGLAGTQRISTEYTRPERSDSIASI
jgi:hypothetical protein